MMNQSIALYNWTNGVIMIAIFAIVCLTLIGFLIKFMVTGDRKKENKQEE